MQMDYQLRLQGSSNGFQPCLALLCCESRAGPYARARARLLRHRAPRAQPLSLSSCSPVLLWQPRRGVQDLTLLGDAPAGGRWRRRGAGGGGGQGPCVRGVDRWLAPWGRARGAHWPLPSWDGGLRVAGGDQLVSLPAKAE